MDLTNLGEQLNKIAVSNLAATAIDRDSSNGVLGGAGAESCGKIALQVITAYAELCGTAHRRVADVATGGNADGGIVIDEELFTEDVQVDEELFNVEGEELEDGNFDDGDSDNHSLE